MFFFHEFARFFENKKKLVQELWALTFHDITVLKNPNGARRIAKCVFSGLAILANLRILENMNFAILRTLLEFLNIVMP